MDVLGGKGGWDSGEIETVHTSHVHLLLSLCGKGGWDSGEIETHVRTLESNPTSCGKGGWDSGEIETLQASSCSVGFLEWKGWMGLRRD